MCGGWWGRCALLCVLVDGPSQRGGIQLLASSPPCKPNSMQGKQAVVVGGTCHNTFLPNKAPTHLRSRIDT